jgi:hypothetical protein
VDDEDTAAGIVKDASEGKGGHIVHGYRSPSSGEMERAVLAHNGAVSATEVDAEVAQFSAGQNLGTNPCRFQNPTPGPNRIGPLAK